MNTECIVRRRVRRNNAEKISRLVLLYYNITIYPLERDHEVMLRIAYHRNNHSKGGANT